MSARPDSALRFHLVGLLVHEDFLVLKLPELVMRYSVPSAIILEVCCIVEPIILRSAIRLPVACGELGSAQYGNWCVDLDGLVIDEHGDRCLDSSIHPTVRDRFYRIDSSCMKPLLAGYAQHDVTDMIINVIARLVWRDGIPSAGDSAVVLAIDLSEVKHLAPSCERVSPRSAYTLGSSSRETQPCRQLQSTAKAPRAPLDPRDMAVFGGAASSSLGGSTEHSDCRTDCT
jgi:hypothetical protein